MFPAADQPQQWLSSLFCRTARQVKGCILTLVHHGHDDSGLSYTQASLLVIPEVLLAKTRNSEP
jgi:hypothetical protein